MPKRAGSGFLPGETADRPRRNIWAWDAVRMVFAVGLVLFALAVLDRVMQREDRYLALHPGREISRLVTEQQGDIRALILLAAGGLAAGLFLGGVSTYRMTRIHAALENLNRLKGEFLAIAAHDLRAPLTTLSGVAQLLETRKLGPLTTEQARFIGMMDEEMERMARLIETYLDLTRLEEGALALARAPVDVASLVSRHAARLQPQCGERGVRLEVRPGDAVAPVTGDADRLSEVLDNLLGNALRFSPRGGTVRLAVEPAAGRVRVVVEDEGPGLGGKEMEKIFERFVQGNAGARTGEGLGLGLAISREIVMRHGGRLWAEHAESGRGARFVMELPSSPDAGMVIAGEPYRERRWVA